MTVLIQIHYISSDNRLYRKGEFPLKGRSREQATFDFFKWIQREMPYGAELRKVLCDGEDITELVEEIIKKDSTI